MERLIILVWWSGHDTQVSTLKLNAFERLRVVVAWSWSPYTILHIQSIRLIKKTVAAHRTGEPAQRLRHQLQVISSVLGI